MHYFATGTSFQQVQCMHLKKRLPSSCCIPMTIYCPAKKQLASTLIEKCHQELQSKVNVHMKVATSCLTSDDWFNIKNGSIMNYMAVSKDWCLFLELVSTRQQGLDHQFIARDISCIIQHYISTTFAGTVTNNTSTTRRYRCCCRRSSHPDTSMAAVVMDWISLSRTSLQHPIQRRTAKMWQRIQQTTTLRQCLWLSTDARILSSSSITTMCRRHNYRNCRRQWEPKDLFVQGWLNGVPFSKCARPSWVLSVTCIQLLLLDTLWKVCLLKWLNAEESRRPSATTILLRTWSEHSAKHFQFMFGVAHGLSYVLDPPNLAHGLPTWSCHKLENTLFESPEDKVTPSNASQHELLYMQYTKYFIATSQHKNEKLFYYKVLLKGSKIQLEYWLVDECEWLELQTIATKLFKMATSRATAEQNFSTMGFIYWNYATASPPRLWRSLCSSRVT